MKNQLPKSKLFLVITVLFFITCPGCNKQAVSPPKYTFEFQFSPPEWQTAICLPDDPYKTLVDRSGELLYHYSQGGREFGTRISVQFTEDARWIRQDLYSPRVPIVNTFWQADGLEIIEEAFAVTDAAPVDLPAGRDDILLFRLKNTGTKERTINPELIVNTALSFNYKTDIQRVTINDKETVGSSLKMTGLSEAADGIRRIRLEPLSIPSGKSVAFYVQYNNGGSGINTLKSNDAIQLSYKNAVDFWEKKSQLPFNCVEVPDPIIQGLFESSVRNIWQAREIKNGLPALQVGPTCYRGLWIVDGAFLLESAAMVGAGDQARNGVAYELTKQKPDGRIEILASDFWKENGIVLWTCVRHAQLTQDKVWLETIWPKLQLIAEYIKTLRRQTLQNNSKLDDGLNPAGNLDGGIGGTHDEYTNTYWNLTGLKAFIQAAGWLGKNEEAASWQKEYDSFMMAFKNAASRDMAKDPKGNAYLPALMGEDGPKELPQRAQWAFCHAVYPGQIFTADDPLVAGNLAMLEATEREDMVYGTGWNATGIWNYFASFYGHAWLWQGNGQKAAKALYAFGNHAAPTLVWREEQSLKGENFKKVGDMPHNWASAEFVRLTIHLLALDRGSDLHLFEGLPPEWTKPGMVTRLNGIATPFGALKMELKVETDGRSAHLRVEPLTDPSCKNIIVHLSGWTKSSVGNEMILNPAKLNELDIPIN
ncbi:MAG: hypothetical protein IPN68_10390 [Bacteroidetes bacterium]|nr:hypothetical protein [Bacteroidota bacterium]